MPFSRYLSQGEYNWKQKYHLAGRKQCPQQFLTQNPDTQLNILVTVKYQYWFIKPTGAKNTGLNFLQHLPWKKRSKCLYILSSRVELSSRDWAILSTIGPRGTGLTSLYPRHSWALVSTCPVSCLVSHMPCSSVSSTFQPVEFFPNL